MYFDWWACTCRLTLNPGLTGIFFHGARLGIEAGPALDLEAGRRLARAPAPALAADVVERLPYGPGFEWSGFSSKISKITKILQIFGGLVLGCIKTNQNEFCKKKIEKMCLTAFFKRYTMCTLLHRSKFNILAKNRF